MNPAERTIRVFISSTFRDMMRERDLLVKRVFPDLRRMCARRFVTFTEVDLRWGITEEQAAEGQVLPLCLAEIEHSRPYFIGLLGERYGWITDTIRPDVIEREPWLKEHVGQGRSITELEILHGVLNNPEMAGHSFFYFRDPAYVDNPSLSDHERRQMVECDIPSDIEAHGAAEAARRTAERKARLVELKKRIRDGKLPLVEAYANPDALADLVRKQLHALIDRLYPENQTPDPVAQECMAHEAHARSKLFGCIERRAHMGVLADFAARSDSGGKGLVIAGDGGVGKTVLLSAWAREWTQKHPADFVFQHYFGATPDSASPESCLRRLLGELKQRYRGLPQDIPATGHALRQAVSSWLENCRGSGRVVLLLDGLDRIEGGEPDRRLAFLPRRLPNHVVVIASAQPCPALEEVRVRGWRECALPLAEPSEVTEATSTYLGIHARTLSSELLKRLVEAPGSRNLLYLRVVLDELRQFGSHEELPARLAYYLEATEPVGLFRRVIDRWVKDFDDADAASGAHGLTSRALAFILTARRGLSEPELLGLLGDGIKPLPRAKWSPLYLALEPHLVHHGGLLAFGNDYLRQAVQDLFLPDAEAGRACHLALADSFDRQDAGPRKVEELCYHLSQARQGERLAKALCDLDLVECAEHEHRFHEWMNYWRHVDNRPSALAQYDVALADFERRFSSDPRRIFALYRTLSPLLSDLDCPQAALGYAQKAVEWIEKCPGVVDRERAAVRGELAWRFFHSGDLDAAQTTFQAAIDLAEGTGDRLVLARLFNGMAMTAKQACFAVARDPLLQIAGQARSAATGENPLLRKAVAYCRRAIELSSDSSLAAKTERVIGVSNLAHLMKDMGYQDGIEWLYKEAIELQESVMEWDTLAVLLTNLASFYGLQMRLDDALPCLERALSIREEMFGPEHELTRKSAASLAVCKRDMAVWNQKSAAEKEQWQARRGRPGVRPTSDGVYTSVFHGLFIPGLIAFCLATGPRPMADTLMYIGSIVLASWIVRSFVKDLVDLSSRVRLMITASLLAVASVVIAWLLLRG